MFRTISQLPLAARVAAATAAVAAVAVPSAAFAVNLPVEGGAPPAIVQGPNGGQIGGRDKAPQGVPGRPTPYGVLGTLVD